jgi:hypothetical protein
MRKLYDEKRVQEALGVDGYLWFSDRLDRFASKCSCRGTFETEIDNPLSGGKTYINCPNCWEYAEKVERFTSIYFANVPERYRNMFLSNLGVIKNPNLTEDRQRTVLAGLKADPNTSYAFFGPAGTSKTTWTITLYADQLWKYVMSGERNPVTRKKIQWFPIQRTTVKKLLDQLQDYNMHRNDLESDTAIIPAITRDKIEYLSHNGIKTRLFLEEADKIKESEARYVNLFEVIDTLYEHNGQLVINSNMTREEFKNQFGHQFNRRVVEICKIVDLFSKDK